MIEELFFQIISKYKPEDIRKAINENINLCALFTQYMSDLIPIIKPFAFMYRKEAEKINSVDFLNFIESKRIDLHAELIATPRGIEWLNWQISEFKRLFL